jgi:hypothetical protein
MKKYITVINPQGATLDGVFVPISHRILIEGTTMHGYESTAKLFPTYQQFADFVSQAARSPSGTTGTVRTLSWEVADA